MSADWDLLTTAFLHDPPDKALDIRGHERRAARYLEAAGSISSILLPNGSLTKTR